MDNSFSDESNPDLLEQLRIWQQQQQLRLMEQQKLQRQLLLDQQSKLLTMLNNSEDNSNSDSPEADASAVSPASESNSVQVNMPEQIQSVQNRNFGDKKLSFDEIPLKRPRSVKSFNQLLETSLTKNSNQKEEKMKQQTKKFPFLKRGQGISRFGFDPKLSLKSKNLSVATHNRKKAGKENKSPLCTNPIENLEERNEKVELSGATKRTGISQKDGTNNLASSYRSVQVGVPSRMSTCTQQPTVSAPLSTAPKTIQPTNQQPTVLEPRVIQEKTSINSFPESVNQRDKKPSQEEDDLAVFELLERFATINASFSSTSSFIGQLLDKGVTHLPSPSKVINFLSKNQAHSSQKSIMHDDAKGDGNNPISKLQKSGKHVRFSDSIEASDISLDEDKPWLMISPSNTSEKHQNETEEFQASPFISNTCQLGRALSTAAEIPKQNPVTFDDSFSPSVGFPDFKKLFIDQPLKSSLGPSNDRSTIPQTFPTLSTPGLSAASCNEEGSKAETKHEFGFGGQESSPVSMVPIDDPQVVYQSSLLRSRLLSLEREIAHYRRENDILRRTRKEQEEAKLKLEQEQEKFRRYAENEKRRMNLLYTEEQKRVKTEQLKDLTSLKGNQEDIEKLKEELKKIKEDCRVKESKWMANQTKLQDKIRFLELRNRTLTEEMEKLRQEEQNLRRRLNASLRPGAMMKGCKSSPAVSDRVKEVGTAGEVPEIPSPAPIPKDASLPAKALNNELAKDVVTETNKPLVHDSTPEQVQEACGVTNTVLPDGTKLILYPNGNRKEIWPDGKGTQVIYYNGDIKQKLADGSVIYIYADSGTKHTTKQDGTDILEFTSGQIETTYPDGRSQVQYPGGASKTKYPDGREEAQWSDGTKLWTDGKGHGVMTFPSGMREVYTPLCKRREYPDGTIKTVYEDGRSETRYGNGRIRVKDREGHVITDTGEIQTCK